MYMTDSWLSHVVKAMHANPGEKFEVMLKKAANTWNKTGKNNKVSKKTRRRCRNKNKSRKRK